MANQVKVEIVGDASKLSKALAKADNDLGRFGKKLDGLSGSDLLGTFGLAAGAASVAQFAKASIDAASDLEEVRNKTRVVFGESSKSIEDFAKGSAENLGVAQDKALEAAANFAIFGKAAGLSGDGLTGFSTRLTTLASDLASFNNTSPEDAITAISAALRGESEPIRQYGVLLDDATLKQEALAQGLIKTTTQALTPQQRVLAAQAQILKQTSDAQGDFARTSDGLANSQRILSANIRDTQASLGATLIPVFEVLTTQLTKTTALTGEFARALTAQGEASDDAADGGMSLKEAFVNILPPLGIAVKATQEFDKALGETGTGITSVVKLDKTLIEVLKENIASFKATAAAALEARAGMVAAAEATMSASLISRSYDDALVSVGDATAAVAEAQADLTKGTRSAGGASRSAADAARDQRDKQLALESALRGVEDATASVAEAQEEYDRIIKGSADNQDAATAALDARQEAMLDAADAALDLVDAQDRLTQAQADQADAGAQAGDQSKETREVSRAEIDLARAKKRVSDAQSKVTDAVEESTGVLWGYAEGSDEAKAATKNLEDAQLNLEAAQRQAGDAQDELARKQTSGGGAAVDSAGKQKTLETALRNQEKAMVDAGLAAFEKGKKDSELADIVAGKPVDAAKALAAGLEAQAAALREQAVLLEPGSPVRRGIVEAAQEADALLRTLNNIQQPSISGIDEYGPKFQQAGPTNIEVKVYLSAEELATLMAPVVIKQVRLKDRQLL
jgi:hypothetical protein